MTYSVWQSFITNGTKTISGAVVSVFHEGSGAPAALFSSPSGGSIGSSVTSDSAGLARFYVAAGVYRITVTHASFSAEHRHVRIGEMAGVDDAPSDGKQYTRKNSAWSEVTPPKPIDLRQTVSTYPMEATLDEVQAFIPAADGVLAISGDDKQTGTYDLQGSAKNYYSFPTNVTDPLLIKRLHFSGKQIFQVRIEPPEVLTIPSDGDAVKSIIMLGDMLGNIIVSAGVVSKQSGSSSKWIVEQAGSSSEDWLSSHTDPVVITIELNWDALTWDARVNGALVPTWFSRVLPDVSEGAFTINVQEFAGATFDSGAKSVVRIITNPADFIGEVSTGFSPIVDVVTGWPPVEPVSVGDTFYVTHGGTLQGVEYKDPDVNGNHEGFKVLGLPAPEESLFNLLPINKVDASVFVESVEADEDDALGFIFNNTNPANPVLTTELPGYLHPHRIGSSSEQYTEIDDDGISFFRGGDYPYFTGLHPNTSGENVNVTLPAEDGTLARLQDFPTESVITYDDLLLLNPEDYPKHTFYVSDYGNVPVKATLDGTRWMAQRSFVLAAGNPVSTLTGTTSETLMQEVRMPIGILGKAPLIRAHTGSAAVTDGTRMIKYRLSNTSGGASGTQLYGNSPTASAVSQIADIINAASTVWVSSVSNGQFTSDSESAEVYLKITYQLSASEASTALNTYHVYALSGNE